MVRLGAGGLEAARSRGRDDGRAADALPVQAPGGFARGRRLRGRGHQRVREAAQRGDFLAAVAAHTGIQARVITGVEEAALIHQAAVHASTSGPRAAVVIDIGGGSTEITLGTAPARSRPKSFKLGVIRLGERFVKKRSLARGDERRMARHVRHELGTTSASSPGPATPRHRHLGTVLALGTLALQCRATSRFTTGASAPRPSQHPAEARLAEPRGSPQAARPPTPGAPDLIVPGAVLLDMILRQLGADEITLCELSLREGVVLEYIRRNRVHIERVERYPDVRRLSVIELASRCNYAADHSQQVARLRWRSSTRRARFTASTTGPRVARLRRHPARRGRSTSATSPITHISCYS